MSGYESMGGEGHAGMGRMGEDLVRRTGEMVDQAHAQTEQTVDRVRGSAFEMMDEQKGRAADGLGNVAAALRQTGGNLRSSEQAALGQYAERAADTVEQFSQQLREKSIDELFSDTERFARREPEIFLGGAVLLGLLASRFLKASARRTQVRDQGYSQNDYRGSYGGRQSAGWQGEYGREGWRTGEYDHEGVHYRSAGSGGYRTTIASDTDGDMVEERRTRSIGDSEMSTGQEHTGTGRRRTRHVSGEDRGSARYSDEDGMPGSSTGSSQV